MVLSKIEMYLDNYMKRLDSCKTINDNCFGIPYKLMSLFQETALCRNQPSFILDEDGKSFVKTQKSFAINMCIPTIEIKRIKGHTKTLSIDIIKEINDVIAKKVIAMKNQLCTQIKEIVVCLNLNPQIIDMKPNSDEWYNEKWTIISIGLIAMTGKIW